MTDAQSSLKKIEANRSNAKKSTGPKNTTRSRLNAIKHGLLSKETILKNESKSELEKFGRKLRLELSPVGELELILADRIISSFWRLRRAVKFESAYLQTEFENSEYDSWRNVHREEHQVCDVVVSRELGKETAWMNLLRYETVIEKQVYKALHELMRLQEARRGNKPPLPISVDLEISGDK